MSRDLFGVATFDGLLKSINPAWSRQLGRTEEELLTMPFAEIIHPDDLAETAKVVAPLQEGKPVHQFLVRLLKADGSPIAFAWSAVPDHDPDSKFFYTVGRDITAERVQAEALAQAEEALRQSQKIVSGAPNPRCAELPIEAGPRRCESARRMPQAAASSPGVVG